MQQTNELRQPSFSALPIKRALIGAGIALVLMFLFLLNVDEPNPAWPKLWFMKPLIVVQVAGALGGAFYHIMDTEMPRKGWSRLLAKVISLIVYIIALWLGSVLGLDGTLWD